MLNYQRVYNMDKIQKKTPLFLLSPVFFRVFPLGFPSLPVFFLPGHPCRERFFGTGDAWRGGMATQTHLVSHAELRFLFFLVVPYGSEGFSMDFYGGFYGDLLMGYTMENMGKYIGHS